MIEPGTISEEQRLEQEEFMIRNGFKKKDETIEKLNKEVHNQIGELDVKLDRVLRKQEHDYLHAYSIYVKQKETELRTLVLKLNEQNNN